MKGFFWAGKATIWVLAGLLSGVAGCGSTREVGANTPAPTVVSSAQPIAGDDAAGVAGQQGMPVRPVATVPLPVFRTPPRRADAEPAGLASAVPTRSAGPVVVVPSRTSSSKVATKATRTQSGRIIDEAGQPLVGATVLLKGTARGASTDADGNYSLEVPPGTSTFVFGYSGYQDEVAQSRDGQPLTVTLLPLAPKEAPPKKRL